MTGRLSRRLDGGLDHLTGLSFRSKQKWCRGCVQWHDTAKVGATTELGAPRTRVEACTAPLTSLCCECLAR